MSFQHDQWPDAFRRRAHLVRVVDGDTVDLEVDLGFHLVTRTRFRLLGIDAPEVKGATKAAGDAATAWLREALDGRELAVESVKTGKFGRWLATLYARQDDGAWRDINAAMLAAGHARPYEV